MASNPELLRPWYVPPAGAAASVAGWLAGPSDEVGVHQRSHPSTSVCEDHRKRLPVGKAQLLGQATPDGDVPRRNRSVLSRPGVDLDLEHALVHAVADRREPNVMPHHIGHAICRPSPDLIGTPARRERTKKRVPAKTQCRLDDARTRLPRLLVPLCLPLLFRALGSSGLGVSSALVLAGHDGSSQVAWRPSTPHCVTPRRSAPSAQRITHRRGLVRAGDRCAWAVTSKRGAAPVTRTGTSCSA